MKCKRCGFDNPDYLEFCQNCTAPLENRKGAEDKEPTWGFVKAPKWEDPEFSADTVSDNDVPSDYIRQGRNAGKAAASAASAAAAAVGAAAASGRRNARELRDDFDDLGDEFGDEPDELEDEFEDEYEDDYEDDYEYDRAPRRRSSGKSAPLSFLGRFKKSDKYDDRSAESDDDLYDDEDDFDDYNEKKPGRSRINLKPIIKIAGVVAALAVLALIVWLIVRAASGCSKTKEFGAPVVEPALDKPNGYYITIPAAKGTKVAFVANDGKRYETVVTDSEQAKFYLAEGVLYPDAPVEGDTYEYIPQVFIVNADGEDELVPMDSIPVRVESLQLTFDNEDTNITSSDGKVDIKGHIQYPDAELTMNGEKVEIGPDGMFSKEFLFEQPGSYTINVEAKLPNYSIARRTFNVTVEETAVTNPDAFIQMPWEYGDSSYAQRVKSTVESIEVRGKVPEGSSVTAFCASSNATVSTPTVDAEGNFKFTVNMKNQGDYTIKVTCTTAQGNTFEREVHVQRQPDYAPYLTDAVPADYAGFSRADGTKYYIAGEITEMIKEGDYYLAKFKMNDGNTIIIEYHPHYGSGRELHVGDKFTHMYGRSWGPIAQGEENAGTIRFYVWFIEG